MQIRQVPHLASGEVLGTDLSAISLQRARRGCYRAFEIRNVPGSLLRQYFHESSDGDRQTFQVQTALRSMVRFEPFNLVEATSYPAGLHDVIYCQNVLIYFTPGQREQIVRQLAERLRPNGFLLLGPAESLGLTGAGLEPIHLANALIWQRR
jgi:chemotaxis methyl-accepting protein methylase